MVWVVCMIFYFILLLKRHCQPHSKCSHTFKGWTDNTQQYLSHIAMYDSVMVQIDSHDICYWWQVIYYDIMWGDHGLVLLETPVKSTQYIMLPISNGWCKVAIYLPTEAFLVEWWKRVLFGAYAQGYPFPRYHEVLHRIYTPSLTYKPKHAPVWWDIIPRVCTCAVQLWQNIFVCGYSMHDVWRESWSDVVHHVPGKWLWFSVLVRRCLI